MEVYIKFHVSNKNLKFKEGTFSTSTKPTLKMFFTFISQYLECEIILSMLFLIFVLYLIYCFSLFTDYQR